MWFNYYISRTQTGGSILGHPHTQWAHNVVFAAGMIRALRAGAREELDGATRGVVHAHWWFPSGLAAATAAINFLSPGDHVISTEHIYRGKLTGHVF